MDALNTFRPARKVCRNPKCRMKLPEPRENPHAAFCTKGCYEQFYAANASRIRAPRRILDAVFGHVPLMEAAS